MMKAHTNIKMITYRGKEKSMAASTKNQSLKIMPNIVVDLVMTYTKIMVGALPKMMIGTMAIDGIEVLKFN